MASGSSRDRVQPVDAEAVAIRALDGLAASPERLGGFLALGLVVVSIVIGLNLGVWFAAAMVVYAGAAILYQTSGILRDYRTDQHVVAALGLFGAVALLFWNILNIVQARR